jgi:hypothetical protein
MQNRSAPRYGEDPTDTAGWAGTDEYDQFSDVTFANNKITGFDYPGSNSARLYGTEGSTRFTFTNNDFYNMMLAFQLSADITISGNRFHDSNIAIGGYDNYAQVPFEFQSGTLGTVSITGNTLSFAADTMTPISMGYNLNSTISDNQISYDTPKTICQDIIAVANGTLNGNTIAVGSNVACSQAINITPQVVPSEVPPALMISGNTVSAVTGHSNILVNNPGAFYGSDVCLGTNELNGNTATIASTPNLILACPSSTAKTVIGTLALKTSSGDYFEVPTNVDTVQVDQTSLSRSSNFILSDVSSAVLTSGDMIALQASTGFFVSAQDGGGSPTTAEPLAGSIQVNRVSQGSWESFVIEKVAASSSAGPLIQSGDYVQLKSWDGYYCTAENNGGIGSIMDCNRTVAGSWETFQITMGN